VTASTVPAPHGTTARPVVDLAGVGKTYYPKGGRTVVAVQDVDLRVGEKEFVSLVGPSGCGKTTVLNMIMGLFEPSAGTLHLDIGEKGRPGVVFQRALLLPWRTALENILLPSEVGGGDGGGGYRGRRSANPMRERARELLKLVGLEGQEDMLPSELSGGMQQRVSIARALLLQNKLLCMDEPFSALDEFTREQMGEQLLRIWEEQDLTCLFVTHNLFEAVFLSDRVVVMGTHPGRVIAEIEVPLPRPRTRDMLTSRECVETVARMRSLLGIDAPVELVGVEQ
jgi:NitT/TauT family transport system ATP-binding protein